MRFPQKSKIWLTKLSTIENHFGHMYLASSTKKKVAVWKLFYKEVTLLQLKEC